jgi:hypothetical protein
MWCWTRYCNCIVHACGVGLGTVIALFMHVVFV